MKNKTTNSNAWIKPFLGIAIMIGLGVLCGIGGYYLYSYVQKTKTKQNGLTDVNTKPFNTLLYKKEAFLPTLESRYFEKFLKTDKNGSKYLDETVISEIIKDITRRLKKNDGKLYFDYNLLSSRHAILDVLYVSDDTATKDEKSFEIIID
ncbi:MHO_1590 family protein [Mycoplasma sp. HF14]